MDEETPLNTAKEVKGLEAKPKGRLALSIVVALCGGTALAAVAVPRSRGGLRGVRASALEETGEAPGPGCHPGPDYHPPDHPMSPCVKFLTCPSGTDDQKIAAFQTWDMINAADDHGFCIEGLLPGDIVGFTYISGMASFTDGSQDALASIAGIASAVVSDGSSYFIGDQATETANAIAAQTKDFISKLKPANTHKPRTGWGGYEDKNHNLRFGTDEGGIIVAMPKSHGNLYALPNNRLSPIAHHDPNGGWPTKEVHMYEMGRLDVFWSDNIKDNNAWFPCIDSDMVPEEAAPHCHSSMVVKEAGTAFIYAFDSKYGDNQGYYQVGVNLCRPSLLKEGENCEGHFKKLDDFAASSFEDALNVPSEGLADTEGTTETDDEGSDDETDDGSQESDDEDSDGVIGNFAAALVAFIRKLF